VRPEEFPAEWERCKGWLDAALHRGGDTLTLEEVKARIESGVYHFWPASDSAVVTQVCDGSKEKELNILLAGGSLGTLQAMLPFIESFGREMGCSIITILGRPGWLREFPTRDMGYKLVAVLLGKKLNEQGTKDTH
jgi:hypothetical protein